MLGLNGFIGSDVEFPVTEQEMDGIIAEINGLGAASPVRRAAVKKITRKVNSKGGGMVATNNLSAKAEIESRLYLMPQEIVEGLKAQTLQISDAELYCNKSIDVAAYAELWANSDVALAGVTNINNRKLEPSQYFLMTGISLMSGTGADAKAVDYGLIAAIIKNGDFQLTIGQKIVVPKTSCYIFDTDGVTNTKVGYYKLENPKLIPPQTEIKPEIWCGGANAATTCIRIVLHGVIVTKN